MKTLVTGGAGFIGSHLCEALIQRGDDVTVLDNLSTGRKENLAPCLSSPGFQFVEGDVSNKSTLAELLRDMDLVFHFAAAVGVEYVMKDPLGSLNTNVIGMQNLLNAMDPSRAKLIYASTSEVYGRAEKVPFSEEDDRILGPTQKIRWCYACAKALGEYWVLAHHRQRKMSAVILRLFNVCGPRQVGHYGMVMPRFVEQALKGDPLTVYGDGKQSRTFGYVGDVVKGILSLSSEPAALGEVINLGGTETVTILELAARIKFLTQSSSTIQMIPYEEAYGEGYEDMRRRAPDLSKARNLAGYEPEVDLDGMIRRVMEDILSRNPGT